MCVLSIKVPIRKKSGNLFNDPRIKKEGRRTFATIVDCANKSKQYLEEDIKKSKERLITAANNSNNNNIRTKIKTTKTRNQIEQKTV